MANPILSSHWLKPLWHFSSVYRIGFKMSSVSESSLQLPSSKSILQTLGTVCPSPCEKVSVFGCLLFVVLFCLWATAHGFLLPRRIFVLFPYCHIHFSVNWLFIILQVSTEMSFAPSQVLLLHTPYRTLFSPTENTHYTLL